LILLFTRRDSAVLGVLPRSDVPRHSSLRFHSGSFQGRDRERKDRARFRVRLVPF
jgi:hypothetical protein